MTHKYLGVSQGNVSLQERLHHRYLFWFWVAVMRRAPWQDIGEVDRVPLHPRAPYQLRPTCGQATGPIGPQMAYLRDLPRGLVLRQRS